jgi:UDP-N-acetyl-D-mannosaminuronic acid dehydrogenase
MGTLLIELQQKIAQKKAVIGVIGLGYVGLPVACMFAKTGFRVAGLDIKNERVEKINRGENPIEGEEPGLGDLLAEVVQNGCLRATTSYRDLIGADVILIDVETPVDEDHTPRYNALRAACQSLGEVMKDGVLVVVESTIAPGTMDRLVRPLLEEVSGKQANRDFYLGACPERVMPGRLLANLSTMSRVCGGSTPEAAGLMVDLYRNIVEADLDPADLVTAELTKTAENAYRDVNIAFANELALICEAAGGDFLQVRALVNKSPGRNVLLAGAGVGGHCIPKDPWLLAYGAQGKVPLRLIPAARAVNDTMPLHVGEKVEEALSKSGKRLSEAKIAVLGCTYLEDSDDTRNSPSETIVDIFKQKGATVVIHDPYVSGYQTDVYECVEGSDAVVIMVAHKAYRNIDLLRLRESLRTAIMVDGRRLFKASEAKQAGFIYMGIGLGS